MSHKTSLTPQSGKATYYQKPKMPTCCCTSSLSLIGEKLISLLTSIGCAITGLGRSIISKVHSVARSLEGRAHVVIPNSNDSDVLIEEYSNPNNLQYVDDEIDLEGESPRLTQSEVEQLEENIRTQQDQISSLIERSSANVKEFISLLDDSTLRGDFTNALNHIAIFAKRDKEGAEDYLNNLDSIRSELEILITCLRYDFLIISNESDRRRLALKGSLEKNIESFTKLIKVLKNLTLK